VTANRKPGDGCSQEKEEKGDFRKGGVKPRKNHLRDRENGMDGSEKGKMVSKLPPGKIREGGGKERHRMGSHRIHKKVTKKTDLANM